MNSPNPFIDWLAGLPLDTVIAWDDNSTAAASRFAFASWLDIQVPLVEAEFGWNWVWTIEINNPDFEPDPHFPGSEVEEASDEEGDPTGFEIEPDGFALVARSLDGSLLHAVACYEDGRILELTETEMERIETYEAPEIEGMKVFVNQFVEIESINKALSAWVQEKSGRSDISFRFEPEIGPSPMVQVAIERMEEIKEKKERGEETGLITMEFDNPEFMADFLDCSLEEAKEHIRLSNAYGDLLRAKLDRDAERSAKRAKDILARLKT
jgi:hypothetical protein